MPLGFVEEYKKELKKDHPDVVEAFGKILPDQNPFAQAIDWEDGQEADFVIIDYVDGSADFAWRTKGINEVDIPVLVSALLEDRQQAGRTIQTLIGGAVVHQTSTVQQRMLLAQYMGAVNGSKEEKASLDAFVEAGGDLQVVLLDPEQYQRATATRNRAQRRALKKRTNKR